jgi:predicted O-methyltransferase YrrM
LQNFFQIIVKKIFEKIKSNRIKVDTTLLNERDKLLEIYNNEYRGNIKKILEVLENHSSIRSKKIKINENEIKEIESNISKINVEWKNNGLRLGGLEKHTEILVAVSSFFDAPKVLEVGVANGYSTSIFHEIFFRSDSPGCIHSIDMPIFERDLNKSDSFIGLMKLKFHRYLEKIVYPDKQIRPNIMWRGGVIPDDKYCGWLVPIDLQLNINSKLFIGNVNDIYKKLPNNSYDIILLDAMKDEKSRIKLLEESLILAKKGSFIIQDGGWLNSAVDHFCEKNNFQNIKLGRLSVISIK